MTWKHPIQELRGVITELRKYAHSPDCGDFLKCPTEHQNCKWRLGLDTSIAWELADMASDLLEYIVDSKADGTYSAPTAQEAIIRVAKVGSAFDRVLFRHGYKPLRYEIIKLPTALAQVLKWLKEEGKKGGNL